MAVELTRIEEFALITLNRPEALNALSFAIIRELGEAFDAAAASDARALFITGAGAKAFCAGADIKELIDNSAEKHRDGVNLGQQIFSKLDNLPIPSAPLPFPLHAARTSEQRRAQAIRLLLDGRLMRRFQSDAGHVFTVQSFRCSTPVEVVLLETAP